MGIRIYREHFIDSLDASTAAQLFKASVCNVEISISSFCNRACPYCPNALIDRKSTRNFIDDAVITSILNQLCSIQYEGRIAIHRYNEPLADKDYAIRRIQEIRSFLPAATLAVVTNGDYLTKKFVHELRDSGVSHIIASSHALENDSTPEALLRRQDEGLHRLGLPFTYLQNREEGRYAVVDVGEGMIMQWNAINYYHRNADGVSTMLDRGQSLPFETHYSRTDPCPSPFTELQVEWDGKVLPCCNIHSDLPVHEKYVLGQIDAETNIFLVWTNPNFVAWRKELFSYKLKSSPCTACHYSCMDDTPELRAFVEDFRKRLIDDEQ